MRPLLTGIRSAGAVKVFAIDPPSVGVSGVKGNCRWMLAKPKPAACSIWPPRPMTAAHDRGSLKKIAPSEVAHQPIRTLRVGGFDGTRAATAAPRASSASAKVCGSGTGLRFGGGALAAAALRTATTYRVLSLLKSTDKPFCGEKARGVKRLDKVWAQLAN